MVFKIQLLEGTTSDQRNKFDYKMAFSWVILGPSEMFFLGFLNMTVNSSWVSATHVKTIINPIEL